MSDNIYKYTLETILDHIETCEKRFIAIQQPEDFVASDQGTILLDAIVARLQAIGENIKSISKKSPILFEKYPQIEWEKIIRFRDFISHHYEMLDYEIVFQICKIYLPNLKNVVSEELQGFQN